MGGDPGRTLICSVVFADLVGYSRAPVRDQVEAKRAFVAALDKATVGIEPGQIVVADAGDGAAVTCLGDPEDALFVAMTLRRGLPRGTLRLGINLGPVKLATDSNGRPAVVGDAINTAARVMSFAEPGQLLVSRSYVDAVGRVSGEFAALFTPEGTRADKHVREHEVYSVGESAAAFALVASGVTRRAARPAEPERRPRGLVAEDEMILREELKDLLAQVGPELELVAAVGDGIAAVREFERLRPDVVFLDIQMPGMSGIEVAHALASRAHVVFATAYDQYAIRAFEEGAIDYVLKPYSAARVMETCKRVRARLAARMKEAP
jgi:CheY-like chemotaxis protein/class 3 adenylate cyclase